MRQIQTNEANSDKLRQIQTNEANSDKVRQIQTNEANSDKVRQTQTKSEYDVLLRIIGLKGPAIAARPFGPSIPF
jgi:hypothetical protein